MGLTETYLTAIIQSNDQMLWLIKKFFLIPVKHKHNQYTLSEDRDIPPLL